MVKYIITEKQLKQIVEYFKLNESTITTIHGIEGGKIVFEKNNKKYPYNLHVNVHLPLAPDSNILVTKITKESDGGYLITGKDKKGKIQSASIGRDRVETILNAVPKDKIVSEKPISTITLTLDKKGIT